VQACRREHRDDEVAALKLQMLELGFDNSNSGSSSSSSTAAHRYAPTAVQLAGIRKQLERIANGTAAVDSGSSSDNSASVKKAIRACHEV
jgi:hypothetical protein